MKCESSWLFTLKIYHSILKKVSVPRSGVNKHKKSFPGKFRLLLFSKAYGKDFCILLKYL